MFRRKDIDWLNKIDKDPVPKSEYSVPERSPASIRPSIEDDISKIFEFAESVEKDKLRMMPNRSAHMLESLEGKTIYVTVVSVDIVNSTKKTGTLPNKRRVEYIRGYIGSMKGLIEYYGGFFLKSVGDCAIGFFPCSRTYHENQDRAVICGLAMCEAIKRVLDPLYVKKRLPSVASRVSIESGEVEVVREGSELDTPIFDLLGKCMDSVVKISHYAKPNEVVIGESLFRELLFHPDFEFRQARRRFGGRADGIYNVMLRNSKKQGVR